MARIALTVSSHEGEQPANEEQMILPHGTIVVSADGTTLKLFKNRGTEPDFDFVEFDHPAQPRQRQMSKSLIVTIRNVLIVVGMSLGMALTTPGPIHAQDFGGNVDRGRTLARAWCAQCHRVEPGTFGIFDADFGEVAKLPSTTALSLRVFLQSSHKEMPNFSLKPAEADDIIAYILSFKRK